MPQPLIVFKSGSVNSDWLLPRLQQHFDIQPWCADKKYTDQHILWHWNHSDAEGWTGPCIYEKLWDQYVDQTSYVSDRTLHLSAKNWIRFNESIWWQHLGYNHLKSQTPGDKFFLMLMNGERPHRNTLFNAVQPWLDQSLYSYYEKGHQIPGDLAAEPFGANTWQRYCNIEWYNSTQFSLVAESMISTRLWISEKTYKPLAFGHALIVWGSLGTLEFVRSQGFETFGHCIDESYDSVILPGARLQAIIKQLEFLNQQFVQGHNLFDDAESQKRIQHNHNLFYDPVISNRLFLTELVEPIQKFIDEQT